MTKEQLNIDYKNACREEMKKDLIKVGFFKWLWIR